GQAQSFFIPVQPPYSSTFPTFQFLQTHPPNRRRKNGNNKSIFRFFHCFINLSKLNLCFLFNSFFRRNSYAYTGRNSTQRQSSPYPTAPSISSASRKQEARPDSPKDGSSSWTDTPLTTATSSDSTTSETPSSPSRSTTSIVAESHTRLPFKFAVKHGRKLGTKKWSNGQLRLPNGEVFEVGLTKGKEPKFLFFKRGWTKFMMENSIKEDFFLTFEYVDRSRFNLRIFDKSATEIVYESPAPDPEQEWKAVVEELLAKGIHVVKTFRRVFCNMSSRSRIALRSAMNSKAVEKFPPPSFVFMIQSTNPLTGKAYFFTVPRGIVEELEIRGGDTVNLRVSGVGSDGFEVNLEKTGSSIRITGREWIRFYDENELKTGDVCHFQAVESLLSIGFEFEVSIFRA
ncbi:B3 domain-containing transcription factor VRN1, partial [Linum perenne]